MEKRGISAVVATILIILIVVAGVGIVWQVILPLFNKLNYFSYSEVQLDIVLGGYTVYDPAYNFAFVQIERGKDDVNVTGLEIGFSFNGTTKTYQTLAVPSPNGKYTYSFNFTNDSIYGIPGKVTVAPIFILRNKIKLGQILDEEDMPIGPIWMSEEEWARANEAAVNILVIHPGPGDTPGTPIVPIVPEEPESCVVSNTCAGGDDCTDEVPNNDVDENCDGLLGLNDCAVLDVEGGKYVLAEDLTVSVEDLIVSDDLFNPKVCFSIAASDVTLNFIGNSLIGPGSGTGIKIECLGYSGTGGCTQQQQGFVLMEGGVSGFDHGIYLGNLDDSSVQSFHLENCRFGVYSFTGTRNNYSDIFLVNNHPGTYGFSAAFNFISVNHNLVKNVSSSGNQGQGIMLNNVDYSYFENINTSFNTGNSDGIDVVNGAHNTFVNIFTAENGDDGMEIEGSINNSVYGLVSINNKGVVDGNGEGIKLDEGSHHYLENIYVSGNVRRGVDIEESDYNTFVNIVSEGNGESGFVVRQGANNNAVIGLTSFENTDHGLEVRESSMNNILTNLNLSSNGINGARFSLASGTIINGTSSSCGNTIDYYCSSSSFINSASIFDLNSGCGSSLVQTATCP